jgi:hypothetical protein
LIATELDMPVVVVAAAAAAGDTGGGGGGDADADADEDEIAGSSTCHYRTTVEKTVWFCLSYT